MERKALLVGLVILGLVVYAVPAGAIDRGIFFSGPFRVQSGTSVLPVLPEEIEQPDAGREEPATLDPANLDVYPVTGLFRKGLGEEGFIVLCDERQFDIRGVYLEGYLEEEGEQGRPSFVNKRPLIIDGEVVCEDINIYSMDDENVLFEEVNKYTDNLTALKILFGNLGNSSANNFYPHGADKNETEGSYGTPGLPILFADENGNFFDKDGDLTAQWCRLLSIYNSWLEPNVPPRAISVSHPFIEVNEVLVKFDNMTIEEWDKLCDEGKPTSEDYDKFWGADISINEWRKRAGLVTAIQNEDGSQDLIIVTDVKWSWWNKTDFVHYLDMNGEKYVVRADKFLEMLDSEYGYAAYGPPGLIWGE